MQYLKHCPPDTLLKMNHQVLSQNKHLIFSLEYINVQAASSNLNFQKISPREFY